AGPNAPADVSLDPSGQAGAIERLKAEPRLSLGLLLDTRQPIVAISQSQATGPFSQHGSNFVVLDARRSQKQVRNNSRPKDTSMQAKAVKGLSDAVILARGGYATKATALGGTGKVADRHSHTVQDGYSGIVEQPFVPNQTPQTLFARPTIGY